MGLNSSLASKIYTKAFTFKVQINANSNKWYGQNEWDISVAGYKAIGVIGYYAPSAFLNIYSMRVISNGTISVAIRNEASNAVDDNMELYILYLKN